MTWITDNLSSIIIGAVLILIVTLIIVYMVRNKKKGKSSCGGKCSCCPMGGSCHNDSAQFTVKNKQ